MKKFLAVYIGTPAAFERSKWNELSASERSERERVGIAAWKEWGRDHADQIVYQGGPLGKTKVVTPEGMSDIKNAIAGYVVVQAESHEAAAKLFEGHPHFTIFPGDSVEIMECLQVPAG